jgi:hypothetical protein
MLCNLLLFLLSRRSAFFLCIDEGKRLLGRGSKSCCNDVIGVAHFGVPV